MWEEIKARMLETQRLQDCEGGDHPGQTQVFTFSCPTLLRWWLKAKAVPGLTFERYNGETYGIFRAQK